MAAQIEHKGEVISFREYGEEWEWGDYKNASLAKVKEYVDRQLRTEFHPTPAYLFGWHNREVPEKVTATSPVLDDEKNFWIKNSKGKRSKEGPLFEISPENDALLKQIEAKAEEVVTVQGELNALHKKLKPLKPAHLKRQAASAASGDSTAARSE